MSMEERMQKIFLNGWMFTSRLIIVHATIKVSHVIRVLCAHMTVAVCGVVVMQTVANKDLRHRCCATHQPVWQEMRGG